MGKTVPDRFVSVIPDQAIDKTLDYAIPEPLLGQVLPGMRVLVPIRGSVQKATIFSLKPRAEVDNPKFLKELLQESPLLPPDLMQLAEWMSRYYCCPLRKIFKLLIPSSIRGKVKPKVQLLIKAALSANALSDLCQELRRKQPTQAHVLDVVLKSPKGVLLSQLMQAADVSRSPIDALVRKKILQIEQIAMDRSTLWDQEYFQSPSKTLGHEQADALSKIKKSLEARRFETHLLHGVTGSGKTEIYLQAIEYTLSMGKGAILLVPEIALTSQTIERLRSRFKEKIAILHHRLSHGERFDSWHQIQQGKASIVVGARSALFSPLPNLGLIIVDEEHEPSYKQAEEAPTYHARDIAVLRGKISSATVLLGSATPSIESYYNSLMGKYSLSTLTTRANQAHLPQVHIIDMQREFQRAKGFTIFSDALITGIKKRVEVGEQVLLFLNRRGYHTSQKCQACAQVIQCPTCDVSLTFHLGDNLLACHLCDYRLCPPPRICPHCKAEGMLKFKGVGTELVERSLHALLPEVRTLRLDADTTRHKGSHEILFKQFRSGKADVLIGTQMIAKGLHFPAVTLVGVLNADAALSVPDFRASENTFQLITQVAGRSGRGQIAGEVIIQTHLPDHPLIKLSASANFEAFYEQEIAVRKLFHYPPFTHLAKFTFTADSLEEAKWRAQTFRTLLIQKLPASFEILPAIPCGHAKIKNQFRFQFLLKAERLGPLPLILDQLKEDKKSWDATRPFVDIDPLSTFF
jgi:primosomal protein N' (replication factor Y)